jgi:hypothetical protein
MWTRIFLGVFAAALLVVIFFDYYAWGWLESIGRPEDAISGYQYTSGIAWSMLCVTSVVLAFVACGVVWTTTRAWSLWLTFAFFSIFVLLQGFVLDRSYQQLLERSTGIETKVWGTPVISALIVLGAAVLTLALHYLVVILRPKFYPTEADPPEADDPQETESSRLM